MIRRRALLRGLALALPVALPELASAQDYPSRPIRLIAPNPPGGSTDIVARRLGKGMSVELGQPVVIENRGGASGMLGAQAVARAAPDGYTLLLATTSVMTMNAITFAQIPYDPVADFAAITQLVAQPLVFATYASFPARTLPELLKMAKAAPGKLNFANTAASGSLPFLYLMQLAGVEIVSVPYAGAGPGLTALLGGQIEVLPLTLGAAHAQLQAGKIRALAVTSAQRSPLAPDIPTVAEQGFPGYVAEHWNGLVAPAGTPAAIIQRLNQVAVRTMAAPEVAEQFAAEGTSVVTSAPQGFEDRIRADLMRWKKVAADSGLKPQ